MPDIELKFRHDERIHNKVLNSVTNRPTTTVHKEVKGHWAGHQSRHIHTASDAGTTRCHVAIHITR
jgi:hypothetical protein